MDPVRAKQHIPESSIYTYGTRDAIIYALGIGANPRDDLHFVYEGHPDFQVFPTFVVAPGLMAQSGQTSDWPGMEFDLSRVLHGEHYIELHGQLPTDGAKLRTETRLLDILDKGKAALIIKEVTTYDDRTGQKLAVQEFGIFQSGSGGFGGNHSSEFERKSPPIPQRAPDVVMEQIVGSNQAALYRQGSGDLNPLHIDPEFARSAGFPRPILHGLCSLGIASRLVLQAFGKNQAKNLRSIKVRFSSPVEPGQTLMVEMWQKEDEPGRVLFQAKIKETGKVALSNGNIELLMDLKYDVGIVGAKDGQNKENALVIKSDAIFKAMHTEMSAHRDALKGMQAVLVYDICSGGNPAGKYTIELRNGTGEVYKGGPQGGQKPTVTVTVEDEDFVKLINGELNGTKDAKGVDNPSAGFSFGGLLNWFGPLLNTLLGRNGQEE